MCPGGKIMEVPDILRENRVENYLKNYETISAPLVVAL